MAEPVNVTVETGKVIVCVLPALTTGFVGSGFTVITTSELADAFVESVAVKRNVYEPCTKLFTKVVEADGATMLAVPPETSVQAYALIGPLTLEAVPVKVTLLVGNVIVCATPEDTNGRVNARIAVVIPRKPSSTKAANNIFFFIIIFQLNKLIIYMS